MEKAESLRVTRGDFFASLENDIKPVSGHWGTAGTATVQSVMGGGSFFWDHTALLPHVLCCESGELCPLCVPVAAWRVIKRARTDKNQLGVSSPCHCFPF